MTRSAWNLTTSRFALAAALAAGLAAWPAGFGDVALPNAAAAQTVGDDEENALGTETEAEDESGLAEEFMTNPATRIGGPGSVGISSGEQRYADPASINVTDSPHFQRYSQAAESDDLEEAGRALSAAADRPVTEDYVEEVNEQLGVRTSLTAEQITEAANEEPLPY